jgi:glutathione synthase
VDVAADDGSRTSGVVRVAWLGTVTRKADSGLGARHLGRDYQGAPEPAIKVVRAGALWDSGAQAELKRMRILFVVNSTRTLRPTYTTVYLASAACRRRHDVAFVSVDDLSHERQVIGRLVRVDPESGGDPAALADALKSSSLKTEDAALGEFDVVLLRNNPHVGDGGFIRVNPAIELGRRMKQAGVMVLNDPDGLRRAGSKMYLAGFPAEIRPKTLITCSADRVRTFLRELDGSAVIKPLFGYGGRNVFFVGRGETANLAQIISTVGSSGYLIVQEYVAAAARGDKRVLLLAGVPLEAGGQVAVYRRLHASDDMRNNMHMGASRLRCRLTKAERKLCETIRPRLVADGLYLVGVGIAGDKILEINVFAAGGLHNMRELYNVDLADAAMGDLERRLKLRDAYREPVAPHVFMRG